MNRGSSGESKRLEPMLIVELDASECVSMADFCRALSAAVGAPEWHGSSSEAFIDSMVVHDDINALKAPYTIRIMKTGEIAPDLTAKIRAFADSINRAAAPDYGTDLEVTIEIAS